MVQLSFMIFYQIKYLIQTKLIRKKPISKTYQHDKNYFTEGLPARTYLQMAEYLTDFNSQDKSTNHHP